MDTEIRELLQQYSRQYITADHVSFTENLVAGILDLTRKVPLMDFAGSLTILPEPFHALFQSLHLATLTPYDEIPQTTTDALAYIKRELGLYGGNSDILPRKFTDGPEPAQPPELFLPIISRKSRKKTPLLNKSMNGFRAESLAALLSSKGVAVLEQQHEEPLSPDDIFDFGYKLDDQIAPKVKGLLQSTANMVRPYKNWKNSHLDQQSLAADQGNPYDFPRMEFLPLFPRVPVATDVSKTTKNANKSAAFTLPKTHGDMEIDMVGDIPSDPSITRENLVMVDGWAAIQSSPPSLPSTPEEEIDELDPIFMDSTPDKQPSTTHRLAKLQMAPVLIPRSREIGGTEGLTPHILANKTVASYLIPLLSQPKDSEEKRDDAHINRSLTSSMVGCDSSALTSIAPKGLYDLPDGLDDDLEGLYRNLSSPHRLILNERLDNIKCSMMDVPDLPEPNKHAPNMDFILPTSFAHLLKPKKGSGHCSRMTDTLNCLEKTKGQHSLALSLSWVSFTTTEKLPTIPQLVGADELDLERIQPQVDNALALLKLDDNYVPLYERVVRQDDTGTLYIPPCVDDEFRLLLNRQELKRVAKRNGEHQWSSSSESGRAESEDHVHRNSKRPRLESDSPVPEVPQIGHVNGSQQLPPSSPPLLTPSDGSGCMINQKATIADSDGKENMLDSYGYHQLDVPPFSSYLSYASSSPHYQDIAKVSLPIDLPDDDFMDFEADGFEPLCMDSYPLNAGPDFEEPLAIINPPQLVETRAQLDSTRKPRIDESLAAFEQSRLAQNSLIGIADFARLRGKRVTEHIVTDEPVDARPEKKSETRPAPPRRAPVELADKNTLVLPCPRTQPSSLHRYIGSLDVIQKRGLVLALQSPRHLVDIAERGSSVQGTADLVLDPYSAIIFFSLFTLPAHSEAYLARICAQSWKYKKVYVVFEAFPGLWARVTDKQEQVSEVSAYTPHIVKAMRRFRRDVEVAAACGTRDRECVVKYAFADTVDEAAAYVRMCGDLAESEDLTDGLLWGEREWLLWKDDNEDEDDLAFADGMNSFSAALLLCNDTLDCVISMSPEQRLAQYAQYIGQEAVVKLNAAIEQKLETLQEQDLEILGSDLL